MKGDGLLGSAAVVDRSTPDPELLMLTVEIVEARLARGGMSSDALPELIRSVHDALASAARPKPVTEAAQPAVPVKRSVQHEYLVCLEDGAKVKTLKRYIGSRFGLTPEAYRARWQLPADYPMVAPAYSARRSAMAKQLGLGRRAEDVVYPEAAEPPEVRHTAASVFANFGNEAAPDEADDPAEVSARPDGRDKPKRKRFAQQVARKMPSRRRA